MSLAIAVERGGFRIVTKPNGAVLVGDGSQGQTLTEIKIPRKQTLMALVPVNIAVGLFHCFLQLSFQAVVALDVVELVADADLTIPIDRHAVLRFRQILLSQPEITAMLAHQIQRPTRANRR